MLAAWPQPTLGFVTHGPEDAAQSLWRLILPVEASGPAECLQGGGRGDRVGCLPSFRWLTTPTAIAVSVTLLSLVSCHCGRPSSRPVPRAPGYLWCQGKGCQGRVTKERVPKSSPSQMISCLSIFTWKKTQGLSTWLCVLLDKSRERNIKSSSSRLSDPVKGSGLLPDWVLGSCMIYFWKENRPVLVACSPQRAMREAWGGAQVSAVAFSAARGGITGPGKLSLTEKNRVIAWFDMDFWRAAVRNGESAALKAPFQEIRVWNHVALSRCSLLTGFSSGLAVELLPPSFLSPVHTWRIAMVHAWGLEKNGVNSIWLTS